VVVARGGKTTRSSLTNTVELLSKGRIGIMGIVLDDIDFRRERYYYAYQYKYYGKYYDEERTERKKVRRGRRRVDKKRG
jgi:Mrp family chromosome partitioning ATPase